MRGKIAIKIGILAITVIFGLGASLALAAEQWCLDKNVKGVCSVRECPKGKTKTTIAGPFASREEAMKAKENSKDCATKAPAKKQEKKQEKKQTPK